MIERHQSTRAKSVQFDHCLFAISIPAEILGGKKGHTIKYQMIGKKTEGIGTFQFGSETKKSMEEYGRTKSNGWKANNVFGEGSSPKLRSIRDGLNSLGLDSGPILEHGLAKIIYGVPLVANLKEYLLGIHARPRYLFDMRKGMSSIANISKWWLDRWVTSRIDRKDVIERIRENSLARPISHRARVQLPRLDVEQYVLFQEATD